ncbi:Uncharacterised protein [Salmonella enterica subsp. enterica serovar Bovismorbificans]|uniref:Uncharacterized protein n=1 Tax=Salmonella enterica subsp. enterica serovar Bovismorbificans TaxID=58097 RepID=A0A655BNK5_SALET|nr:Uncharacterised protein [Salmonella enterica subsp. enterica serovar Bovismorbificans]VFS80867.1 Uncharacterised protein [Salmonella enterica subsp. enterica]
MKFFDQFFSQTTAGPFGKNCIFCQNFYSTLEPLFLAAIPMTSHITSYYTDNVSILIIQYLSCRKACINIHA